MAGLPVSRLGPMQGQACESADRQLDGLVGTPTSHHSISVRASRECRVSLDYPVFRRRLERRRSRQLAPGHALSMVPPQRCARRGHHSPMSGAQMKTPCPEVLYLVPRHFQNATRGMKMCTSSACLERAYTHASPIFTVPERGNRTGGSDREID